MTNSLENRVGKLKEQGFNLEIIKVMKDAFNGWKKVLFNGIFMVAFSFIFLSLIHSILSKELNTSQLDTQFQTSIINFNKTRDVVKYTNDAQNYIQNPNIITKYVLLILSSLLLYPLGAGLVYCAYKQDTLGVSTFKDLIHGYQGTTFFRLLGLIIIFSIIFLVSQYLLFIPAIYFSTVSILAGAFIIIDNASLLNALKYSFRIVNMKFFRFLPILIISFTISKVLGSVLLPIGLALTLPFSSAIVYSLYKNTIGTIEMEESEEII